MPRIAATPARRAAAALVGTFVAVAVTFAVATVIAETDNVRVRAIAGELTGRSSGKIALLSSIRGTMRDLEVRSDDFFHACARPPCTEGPGLEALWSSLRAAWAEYQALPAVAGEDAFRVAFGRELEDLHAAFAAALDALRRADVEAARARFLDAERRFDAVDALAARLVELDVAHHQTLTLRIDALARRSIVLSVVLDLLCIALTVLAGALVVRMVVREDRMLRARAEELDRFAGQVAHDILSPLWSIDSAVYLARRGADEAGRRALDGVAAAVGYVRTLVHGLLDYARSRVGPAEGDRADVGAVLRGVVEQLATAARERGVQVELEARANGEVACSQAVFASIVGNLVENAIRHIGSGALRRVDVAATVADGVVRVQVVDTGPGVDPGVQGRIFEPFVRGQGTARGYGLGLATVKRLVEAHHGRVGFSSDPGAGATFWVELPTASAARPGRERATAAADDDRRRSG